MPQSLSLPRRCTHWRGNLFPTAPAGCRRGESQREINILTIGFSKHTDFYDRVPPRTVIARSEATRAARERRQWPSSDRRQRRRQGSKKLGSHLVLRKQRAAQNLSGNPEEPSDRSGWAGACVCANNVQRKCLAPTRKSVSQRLQVFEYFRKIGLCRRNGLPEGELPRR